MTDFQNPDEVSANRSDWIVFVQSGGDGLTRMSIRGVMLMVLTIGLYRFWFVSDLRRFFWSRTLVDDSPLEYTGRGLELFIGFLIAVAILLPLGLGLFGLSLISQTAAIIGNISYFVILIFLGQYALFRARRYRLNRTTWRGLRLHLTGSAWKYAFMSMGWTIFAILTLGLAWPWASASLERFRVNHTWYGNLQFHSSAKWSDIIKPFMVIWGLIFLPIVAIAVIGIWANLTSNTVTNGLPGFAGVDGAAGALGFIFAFLPFVGLLLYPWYKAVIMRTYFSHIKAHTASLKANFSTGLLYKIWFKTILATIVASVGLGIIGSILYFFLGAVFSSSLFLDQTFLTASGVIAYVIWIAVSYVITITFYHFGIWQNVGSSLIISNPGCIEEVLAGSKETVGGINEGFADALDVGGGFEIGL